MQRPLFILAGNGPYLNRGCEAIVRGTVEIIRKYYQDPIFVAAGNFNNDTAFHNQIKHEIDPSITHKRIHQLYFTKFRFFNKVLGRSYKTFYSSANAWMHRDILNVVNEAEAVLSVGGDNYSLDYGTLENYVRLDDYVNSKKKKLIIWGASVGPFSANSKYENMMGRHLKEQTGIFVRETASLEYLKSLGVTDNVYLVGDPAFMMEPKEPAQKDSFGSECLSKTIGLNFSPLMARYLNLTQKDAWFIHAANIVQAVSKYFQKPILLIPHVGSENPAKDDYLFMKRIVDALGSESIRILPSDYSAAELKWIISRLLVFGGARTHATIAAFSTLVPTVSFAYSIKAEGINQDILGDLSYCIKPKDLNPDKVCQVIDQAIKKNADIRNQMAKTVPIIKERALRAGEYLTRI